MRIFAKLKKIRVLSHLSEAPLFSLASSPAKKIKRSFTNKLGRAPTYSKPQQQLMPSVGRNHLRRHPTTSYQLNSLEFQPIIREKLYFSRIRNYELRITKLGIRLQFCDQFSILVNSSCWLSMNLYRIAQTLISLCDYKEGLSQLYGSIHSLRCFQRL